MAGLEPYELFILVLGDSPPSMCSFSITAPASDSVGKLRELVYTQKQNRLKGIDANELVLWKLKNPLPVGKVDEAVGALGDLSAVAEKMVPLNDILDHFPITPERKHLHLIVQAPSLPLAGQKRGLSDDNTDDDALRVGMQKKRRLYFLEGSKTVYKSEADPDRLRTPLLPSSSNFVHLVNTPNIIFADKTRYIEELDKAPQYQRVLLRPRRWGKSIFLQMLANYYNLSKAHEFVNTFGQLYIGKNPTIDRSSLLVLVFDFSGISAVDYAEAKKQLDTTIIHVLRKFLETNKAVPGLFHFGHLVERSKRKLFLRVDEYDAPANACLFSEKIENYWAISNHIQARFFAIIKQAIGFSIQKYWITGVLPAFRDGFTPLLATQSISMSPLYHNVCGLTENEVCTIAKAYLASTHDEAELDKELETMKRWLNGHKFYPSGYDTTDVPSLYNPQLVFTHLRTASCKARHVHPEEELNTMNIASVLNAIKDDQELNAYDLLQLLSGNLQGRTISAFGVSDLKGIGRKADITWTFLYYLGVITRGQGKGLVIPNLTMWYLVCVLLAVSLPLSV